MLVLVALLAAWEGYMCVGRRRRRAARGEHDALGADTWRCGARRSLPWTPPRTRGWSDAHGGAARRAIVAASGNIKTKPNVNP